MPVKIGINGFGRIGRQSLRTMLERHPDTLQVTAINDIADLATNAHLFRHDSNYGRFPGRVETRNGELRINDWTVKVFSEREPSAGSVHPGGEGPRSRAGRGEEGHPQRPRQG